MLIRIIIMKVSTYDWDIVLLLILELVSHSTAIRKTRYFCLIIIIIMQHTFDSYAYDCYSFFINAIDSSLTGYRRLLFKNISVKVNHLK